VQRPAQPAETTADAGDLSGALHAVDRALALVRQVLATAPPEGCARPDAHALAQRCGTLEKAVAAATLRYARAAGKEAVPLLAAAAGTLPGSARRKIDVAERASACPPLAQALDRGDLSVDQVASLAPLAVLDASAARALLGIAPTLSVAELRDRASRIIHQRRGELAAVRSEAHLQERRYCRAWVEPSGGIRMSARLGTRDGAAVLAALRREQSHLLRLRSTQRLVAAVPGHRAVTTPTSDQLRADALVRLVTGKGSRRGLGPPELLIRVDVEALRRGALEDGETCEIAGVGPVSVTTGRSILGGALWTLLVTSGSDVRTVTRTTRVVPRKVRNALLQRDRACVVPGCGVAQDLEIDHWARDFAWGGVTALANLALVCRLHHEMKTRTGWRLVGGPGMWRWLPPKSAGDLAEEHARLSRRRGALPARAGPPSPPRGSPPSSPSPPPPPTPSG